MEEVLARVTCDDPVQGNWSVCGEELNVWVEASLLANDVVLERHGDILEDACWLRLLNLYAGCHLSELDTMVKGLNLTLQWQAGTVHLHTLNVYLPWAFPVSALVSRKQDASLKEVDDHTATDS